MKTKMINMTWDTSLSEAHRHLVAQMDTQELGKLRQKANEYMVKAWLNATFPQCNFLTHNELKEHGIYVDPNAGSWDLLCINTGIRVQAKYRAGKNESNRWHMEQTRRTGATNAHRSKNGQVRYEMGEFDIIVFTSPPTPMDDFDGERDLIVLPATALEDDKNPGMMVGRVPPKTVNAWRQEGPQQVMERFIKNFKGSKVKSCLLASK